jgi:cell division control protein 6
MNEVVRNLPAQERLVLHGICRLQQYRERTGQATPLTTGEVYRQYTELAKMLGYAVLSQRRIADFISELDSLGILTAREISKGRGGRTREISITSSAAALVHVLKNDELILELAEAKLWSQTRLI